MNIELEGYPYNIGIYGIFIIDYLDESVLSLLDQSDIPECCEELFSNHLYLRNPLYLSKFKSTNDVPYYLIHVDEISSVKLISSKINFESLEEDEVTIMLKMIL